MMSGERITINLANVEDIAWLDKDIQEDIQRNMHRLEGELKNEPGFKIEEGVPTIEGIPLIHTLLPASVVSPLPWPGYRRSTWIQLFAIALKQKLTEPPRDTYNAISVRFERLTVTVYAATFPASFLDALPPLGSFYNPPRIFKSDTIEYLSQTGRREMVRVLVGALRYLNYGRPAEVARSKEIKVEVEDLI